MTEEVIVEERWSFVVFRKSENWYLTFLDRHGPVEADYTVLLNEDEKSRIQNNPDVAADLVKEFRDDRSLSENRLIIPSVWPVKHSCTDSSSDNVNSSK